MAVQNFKTSEELSQEVKTGYMDFALQISMVHTSLSRTQGHIIAIVNWKQINSMTDTFQALCHLSSWLLQ